MQRLQSVAHVLWMCKRSVAWSLLWLKTTCLWKSLFTERVVGLWQFWPFLIYFVCSPMILEATWQAVFLYGWRHLKKGGDWSQDRFTITHNGVFISKIQFSPVKLHVYVSLSNITHVSKIISDRWQCFVQIKRQCVKL